MYIRCKTFSGVVFIEEKDFARIDYEGLTEEGKASLKAQRDLRAKRLLEVRKANNDVIKKPKWYQFKGNLNEESQKTLRKSLHEKTLANEAIEQKKLRQSVIDKFGEAPKEHVGKAPKVVKGVKENLGRDAVNLIKAEPTKEIAKKGLGKAGKVAAGVTGGLALAGAGTYAYKKYKDRK